jgi:hypothetical protein
VVDRRRFDDLVHEMATARTARRGVLRLLCGGAVAGPLALAGLAEAEAKKKKKKKKRQKGHRHAGGGTCDFATACDCLRWPIGDPVPATLEWCRTDFTTAEACQAACPEPSGYLSINEFLVTRPELGLKPVCALNNDAQLVPC